MADEFITELVDGGALQATDYAVVARAGINVKIAGSEFGGSLPGDTNWGEFNGTQIEIANSGGANLPLTSLGDGNAALLDLTDTEKPAVVDAGVYAVTAIFWGELLTPGGFFDAVLHLDADDHDAVSHLTSSFAPATLPRVWMSLSCTFYIPAGGVIKLSVSNWDGVETCQFKWDECIVQRLS